jgi:hypothetical protein
MTPPIRARAASWLLAFVLPAQDIEFVVGDLEEEYSSRASRRWYWGQLARSVPRLMWLPIRHGGLVPTCGVALAAGSVQALIELVIGTALYQLGPTGARWPVALSVPVTLASLLFVSHEAARLRPGAATVLAVVAEAVGVWRVLFAASAGEPAPLAVLAGLVIVPTMAFAGGVLALRRPPRAIH